MCKRWSGVVTSLCAILSDQEYVVQITHSPFLAICQVEAFFPILGLLRILLLAPPLAPIAADASSICIFSRAHSSCREAKLSFSLSTCTPSVCSAAVPHSEQGPRTLKAKTSKSTSFASNTVFIDLFQPLQTPPTQEVCPKRTILHAAASQKIEDPPGHAWAKRPRSRLRCVPQGRRRAADGDLASRSSAPPGPELGWMFCSKRADQGLHTGSPHGPVPPPEFLGEPWSPN